MKMWTSLTVAQFYTLLDEIPSLSVTFPNERIASDSLFMYLMKLRTAQTNSSIGSFFALSRQSVEMRLPMVRKVLINDFVPRYINFARSRDLISHNSRLSSKLLYPDNPNKVILIWDGTYIFMEKSGNHKSQRITYSSLKKRNHVKVMNCVSTDGTIIGTYGIFPGNENDAKITKRILPQDEPALQSLRPGDVMLADRGFRDCIADLENSGFIVKIPVCAYGKKQLSAEEANETRLVTALRFEVERVNGKFKIFYKIFSAVWKSLSIPHLMKDYTIAAALINKFFSIPTMDPIKEAAIDERARLMLDRFVVPNELSKIIKSNAFIAQVRKKKYATLELLTTFPELNMDDLLKISFGIYQINQAKRYAHDHYVGCGNRFDVKIFSDEVIEKLFSKFLTGNNELALITFTLQSRFVSNTKRGVYILFDRNLSHYESILGYYCDCKNGQRTLGCCSHVMSGLYYLGFVQYGGNLNEIAPHLSNIFTYGNELLLEREDANNDEHVDNNEYADNVEKSDTEEDSDSDDDMQ